MQWQHQVLVAAAAAAATAPEAAHSKLQVTAEPTSRLSDLHQLDHLLFVPSHPVTLLGQKKTQGPTIFFVRFIFTFLFSTFFLLSGASKPTTLHSLFSALWAVIFFFFSLSSLTIRKLFRATSKTPLQPPHASDQEPIQLCLAHAPPAHTTESSPVLRTYNPIASFFLCDESPKGHSDRSDIPAFLYFKRP